RRKNFRRLGLQPVRVPPLSHLFQDLYREGLGNPVQRDLSRLGRSTDQESVPETGSAQRRSRSTPGHGRHYHHLADRAVPLSPLRPRHDVGTVRSLIGQAGHGYVARHESGTDPSPPGQVECVTARAETGERVDYDGAHFISTMPLRELIHALDPLPPEAVLRAAQGLRYRDYLTVVLVVNRESLFPDNWIYIHSPDVKMRRIQNYKNWSPHRGP